MIAAIRHVALVVRDLQGSYEFYHRLFALQQVRHRPGRAIHLSDGFFNLTLLGKRDRTSEEIRNDVEIDSAGEIGFSHFGFQVEKLESALEKLSRLGLSLSERKRPQDGRFVEERINDAEGNRVDLSENGFGTVGAKGTTGICYLTICAKEPSVLADFYQRALDLTCAAGEDSAFILSDGDSNLRLVPRETGRSPGLAALGVRVASVDGVASEIARHYPQMKLIANPNRCPVVSSIHDPDGNMIELIESR